NIKPALAGNLTEYPTAKTLWDALVVTYSGGKDKEILRLDPLPSVEAAYATVRKEAAHQNILGATNHDTRRESDSPQRDTAGRMEKGTDRRANKIKRTSNVPTVVRRNIPKNNASNLLATPIGGLMVTRKAPRISDRKKAKLPLKITPIRKAPPDLGEWRRRMISQ
ncbi:hypothetical protein Tco_0851191, partial [Tanacetum coccineum]